MLYQEDNTESDEKLLNADDRLKCVIKASDKVLGKVKG